MGQDVCNFLFFCRNKLRKVLNKERLKTLWAGPLGSSKPTCNEVSALQQGYLGTLSKTFRFLTWNLGVIIPYSFSLSPF